MAKKNRDDMAENEAARAMIEWASTVSPADLAAELMAAFGPDGPKGGNDVHHSNLVEWLFREHPNPGGYVFQGGKSYGEPSRVYEQLHRPMREALQLLEHAELIYVGWIEAAYAAWSGTRLGRAVLANGKAAVRQRIFDRTGV
ncbi:hypothetical protein ACQP1O_17490 [Nocardia sp. CA-151230]|uniref:hypothetical protein n=1 Tax=Nocardia sp. CA-151230 TaxID=3239982 RepID=UPI003D8A8DC4